MLILKWTVTGRLFLSLQLSVKKCSIEIAKDWI